MCNDDDDDDKKKESRETRDEDSWYGTGRRKAEGREG
jgi:hypothetical protein